MLRSLLLNQDRKRCREADQNTDVTGHGMVQSQSAATTTLAVVPAIPTARFGIFACAVEATTGSTSAQSNAQLHRQPLESQQRARQRNTLGQQDRVRVVHAFIAEQDCLLAGCCCDMCVVLSWSV